MLGVMEFAPACFQDVLPGSHLGRDAQPALDRLCYPWARRYKTSPQKLIARDFCTGYALCSARTTIFVKHFCFYLQQKIHFLMRLPQTIQPRSRDVRCHSWRSIIMSIPCAAYQRYTLLDVPRARSAAFRNSLMSHNAIRSHSLAIDATS
jgi:hypothetical protein